MADTVQPLFNRDPDMWKNTKYYSYFGADTQPPCNSDVMWYVADKIQPLNKNTWSAFASLLGISSPKDYTTNGNARTSTSFPNGVLPDPSRAYPSGCWTSDYVREYLRVPYLITRSI